MKQIVLSFGSHSNVKLNDRIFRVLIGLAILFSTLFYSIHDNVAFPLTNIVASAIVLSGVAGWDPFYAAYRMITRSTHDFAQPDEADLKPAT